MDSPRRKRLLLVKGSFEHFGGGERDLINNLEAWSKYFDLSLATLHPNEELIEKLKQLNIPLFSPIKNWSYSHGTLSEIFAKSTKKASQKWYSMLSLTKQGPSLNTLFSNIDAVNITTGMASLEIIPFIPTDIPIHTYMHEPNRGLHSNDLHFDIDGNPKQNLKITNLFLSKQRRIDEKLVRLASKRGEISGNSKNTCERIKQVYDIESNFLYPSINTKLWPIKPSKDEDWSSVSKEFNLTKNKYIITIGHAIYAKGLWKTIENLSNSNLVIVQIGGGVNEKHKEHARKNNVELKPLPRVSQATIRALMRNARAMVSNAINEPFGLTPPESYFVNCPVIVSNQGGFRETVVDGVTGRLLNEGDDWLSAIEEGHKNRDAWSKAGREHIKKIDLTPETQAKKVYDLLEPHFEEE
ncbi:MAG: glycosyltransferase [Candidatus Poseidoniales archaeon]|nr:MAG: glycosyltransferase [Candidatus Poseidoniales archaeon]|tara:strand:+ start:3978 stop:5213 length:1236 start_codon:yes stop_codon:yes gene_type:complete